tara:strand:+ start:823 stop:2826 length:2004 start_codon:yes stop_codon:yes gene_type:complete
MPAVANVAINIDTRTAAARLKALQKQLNTTNTALKGTAASSAAASKGLAGVGATMAKILGPIIAVSTAVSTVANSFKVLGERESDVKALATGLGNLGAAQKDLEALNKAADELGDATLFKQEDFTKGFTLLTSFRNIGVDAYKSVAEQAANVAQANQVDVKTSFMQLAKALQDPERNLSALNRSGIAFTKQQTEQIKALMQTGETAKAHAMILGIVEESYNGLARAAGSGFIGKLDKLRENFRDLQEALATDMKPAIATIVDGLAGLVDSSAFVSTLSVAFKTLLFPINAVVKLVQGIGESIKANMSPASLAAVSKAWETIVRILQNGFKDGEQFFHIIGRIVGLLATAFVAPVEAVIGIFKRIATWWSNYMQPELAETWKEMGDNLMENFGAPITWIKEKWTGMVEHFKSEITKFWENLPQPVKNFFNWIKGAADDAVQTLKITVTGTRPEEIKDETTVPDSGKVVEDTKKAISLAEQLKGAWDAVKTTVADGVHGAIMGLLDGTKSLKESLAGIAKQIASLMLKKVIFSAFGLAEGGYVSNGIRPFAAGGYTTKPTMGVVGEAGEDEYVIPASKMAESMQRYSSGARGEAVIPGTGSSAGGSAGTSSTTVNYSGPVLNFNSEEFVPKSAIGEIINSAAARGAKAGEARTLSSLQNSRSRRQNIGL